MNFAAVDLANVKKLLLSQSFYGIEYDQLNLPLFCIGRWKKEKKIFKNKKFDLIFG